MPEKQALRPFMGVNLVSVATTLNDEKTTKFKVHVGIADHVSLEEFRRMQFPVLGLCTKNGVRIRGGKKNGKTCEVWATPRQLQVVAG